jgi:hypothetical protein
MLARPSAAGEQRTFQSGEQRGFTNRWNSHSCPTWYWGALAYSAAGSRRNLRDTGKTETIPKERSLRAGDLLQEHVRLISRSSTRATGPLWTFVTVREFVGSATCYAGSTVCYRPGAVVRVIAKIMKQKERYDIACGSDFPNFAIDTLAEVWD